jgi:hypothetical protein
VIGALSSTPFHASLMVEALSECFSRFGSTGSTAEEVRIRKGHLSRWKRGLIRPSFRLLLRLCHYAKISALGVLTGTLSAVKPPRAIFFGLNARRYRSSASPKTVKAALLHALTCDAPPSVRSLCQGLKIDPGVVYSQFSGLAKRLAKKARAYRIRIRREKRAALLSDALSKIEAFSQKNARLSKRRAMACLSNAALSKSIIEEAYYIWLNGVQRNRIRRA